MSLEKFNLVGVRYTRYYYDESVLLSIRESAESYYKIDCEDAEISTSKYKGRPVIEVKLSLRQFIRGEKDASGSQGVDDKEVLLVECVAGFVGTSERDDGDLKLFSKAKETYGRVIYWLARQRVRSLTMGTLLDSGALPHDIRSEVAEVPKPKRSKAKPAIED